jgi:ABC-2 type transport system ATP-binding protein
MAEALPKVPLLKVDGLQAWYGESHILHGVGFEIGRGELVTLLGRNGAGKTTAIRLLLGLIPRDGGSIAVLGRDPQQEPLDVRESVGFLAEDQQMFGWMTVAELLGFIAPFYALWDGDLANRYVKEFDLPRHQRIKNLSKGQNVRLGLVLALAHRPELVILDDPALGLDPVMRKQFNNDLIAHLQGEGTTVLYSSHLLYEVEPIADMVAILHEGVILKQAATESLRHDVKQLVLSAEDYGQQQESLTCLDIRRQRAEVAVTVENAKATIERLAGEGISVRVIDLNLDDIFAAYVAGNREPAGGSGAAASPVAVSM